MGASQVTRRLKNPPAIVVDSGSTPGLGRSPGGGHGIPLQYSCLENPWREGPGRLQIIGSQRVGHDWATELSCIHPTRTPHESESESVKCLSHVRLFATPWMQKVRHNSASDAPDPPNLPGSSVHGIPQATILEWVAISFSRVSSWPRDRILVSYTADGFFTTWTTRETENSPYPHYCLVTWGSKTSSLHIQDTSLPHFMIRLVQINPS